MEKQEINHKYKVKPGLSLTSKDLYRRFRNNSLNIPTPSNAHSLDSSLLDYTRMEKGEQLQSLKNDLETIQKLSK